ncbi:MAG: hypothetical protein LBH28_06075 [Oscillospiraceae bacterium]|jgi:predicted DNA-binding transcriptional regulator YafY|nr:hypothetical protein [Oscillospiraceae bacterium]
MESSKCRILCVKRFLETNTDENHPATMRDILAHLESEGIPAGRASVIRDIEQLIAAGVDVVCNGCKRNEYFIGEGRFELLELKLLVDAVQTSHFISPQKSAALIGKLSSFASIHQAGDLRRSLYTDKQSRPDCDKAYLTVDLLHAVINAGKKVTFKYYEWSGDKKKVYKHGRRDYIQIQSLWPALKQRSQKPREQFTHH